MKTKTKRKLKHERTTLCISNSGFSAILKRKTINQKPVLSDSFSGLEFRCCNTQDMDKDNTAVIVLVRLFGGTLSVRDVSTLSAQSTGNYGTMINPVTGEVWLDHYKKSQIYWEGMYTWDPVINKAII